MTKQYDDPIILAQRQYRAIKATNPRVALFAIAPGVELYVVCQREVGRKPKLRAA